MNTQYPNNEIFIEFSLPLYHIMFLFSKNKSEFYYLHYNLDNNINDWILRIDDEHDYYWTSLINGFHIHTASSSLEMKNYEKEYYEALEKIQKYVGLL